jgi:hypothetical protein
MGLVATVGLAALIVMGIASGSAVAMKAPKTVWLCKPKLENNPCEQSLTATVVQTNGEASRQETPIAKKPPIDCFYVYPTVSEQETEKSKLTRPRSRSTRPRASRRTARSTRRCTSRSR